MARATEVRPSTRSDMRLYPDPTPEDLCLFWRTLRLDATIEGMYMDTMPTHLEDFLAPMIDGNMKLWMIDSDGELAGAHWLHDIQPCQGALSGWFATYYFPACRGQLATTVFPVFLEAARTAGITHVFGGCRPSNTAAKKMGRKVGLHHVGDVERFGWFQGSLDTLSIYATDTNDADAAMSQAMQRAAYHRAHPPLVAV